jgi:hypothetical protein
MSGGVIEHRDEHGVILRFRTDVRGPQHDSSKIHYTDRLRCAVLKGERQLFFMATMLDALEDTLSVTAVDKFTFALRTLENLITLARAELVLEVHEPEQPK